MQLKMLVGALAVVSTLTVAGCGNAVDLAGAHTTSLTKSAFATALTDATSHARSVHVNGTIQAQGQSITMTGDESFGDGTLTGMRGDLSAVLPGMGSLELRLIGGVLYANGGQLLSGQLGGKPWLKIDLTDTSNPIGSMLSQLPATMGRGQFSAIAKGLSTLKAVGRETVDGAATTHYQVSVDTSRLGTALGIPTGQLGAVALPKTIRYDVWLDAGSRPVKVVMKYREYGVDLLFSRWGEPVHVAAPPPAQVGTAGF
jgi:hypothetical protein